MTWFYIQADNWKRYATDEAEVERMVAAELKTTTGPIYVYKQWRAYRRSMEVELTEFPEN